jgi:hypothetical protein
MSIDSHCSAKNVLLNTVFLTYPNFEDATRKLMEHEAACSTCKEEAAKKTKK